MDIRYSVFVIGYSNKQPTGSTSLFLFRCSHHNASHLAQGILFHNSTYKSPKKIMTNTEYKNKPKKARKINTSPLYPKRTTNKSPKRKRRDKHSTQDAGKRGTGYVLPKAGCTCPLFSVTQPQDHLTPDSPIRG